MCCESQSSSKLTSQVGAVRQAGYSKTQNERMQVELVTGRTHQIRGQLAAEGCPIYGDLLYGPPRTALAAPTRQGPLFSKSERQLGGLYEVENTDVHHTSPLADARASEVKTASRQGPSVEPSSAADTSDSSRSTGNGNSSFVLKKDHSSVHALLSHQGDELHGSTGAGGIEIGSFVDSPKMALQACSILLEFAGAVHAYNLGRDTCWWSRCEESE